MTEASKLALYVHPGALHYLVHSDRNNDISTGTIPFPPGETSFLRALENVVYDNEFLLAEYAEARIALHAPRFMAVPQEVAQDEELTRRAFAETFPSAGGDDIFVTPIESAGAAVVAQPPQGVVPFLLRTFPEAAVLHHIAPLIAHALRTYAEETACLHVTVDDSDAHIIAVKGGRLHLANTFAFRDVADIAYYALATWQSLGMHALNAKIMLAGNDSDTRNRLAAVLRENVPQTMNELLPPQALRLGSGAPAIPFPILALTL